jgi:phenylalanyl-tRNA synthetase beta chain
MKLSPQWLREFVDPKVDNLRLSHDLTSVGIAVEGIAGDGENTVFEMEIGTNRPDAMNHYGVAREASAIYNLPLRPLASKLPAPQGNAKVAETLKVEIKDPVGCARYTARILRDVNIKPSPATIAGRLTLVEQRPINNAADATNYTLWEMGHPTHVFDLDLLEGSRILVRRAFSGEVLKTLDGVKRKLTPDDLVIADAVKPVALAGVMGGFDTMITQKTRNILIEAAWFDPSTVRKTSRHHGMHTDASHRFERGADFAATTLACDRVAALILESAGGRLGGERIDTVARQVDLAPVALRLSEVHRILGEKLETNEIFRILKQLGFELMPERGGDPDFTVHIPSWRLDVEREIDVVEEIARLHGYDKFANTLPAYAGAVVEPRDAAKDSKLRASLLALGYNEAVSLTFISHQDAETFSAVPVVELANPQSEEASVMRSSLVPGMLNMLAYNLNRGADDVRLFEAGSVFEYAPHPLLRETMVTAEPQRICLGLTCASVQKAQSWGSDDGGFFALRGDLENLLHHFQYKALAFDEKAADYYRPGRSARAVMDGVSVTQFGQIHPDIASARKLRQDVLIAELYLDRLYAHSLRLVRYEPLPRYPAVERDFSFSFADDVTFERIEDAVRRVNVPHLRDFRPIEVFRGGGTVWVATGSYSILLRARFQSYERTLREEEVAEWAEQIVRALHNLGGSQRVR